MSAPRQILRIAALAATLAGLAAASTTPAAARSLGAGMSIHSLNFGPRTSHQLPAVQRNIGDANATMLGGPDTKQNPGCEKAQVAGCSNNLVPAARATGNKAGGDQGSLEAKGIIIIGGKTSKGPTTAAAMKGFNPQPDPPGFMGN